jgi:hypothetical protein
MWISISELDICMQHMEVIMERLTYHEAVSLYDAEVPKYHEQSTLFPKVIYLKCIMTIVPVTVFYYYLFNLCMYPINMPIRYNFWTLV